MLPHVLAMIAVWVGLLVPAAADSPPAEIHSKHWIHGYPLGAPATNDFIIREPPLLSTRNAGPC